MEVRLGIANFRREQRLNFQPLDIYSFFSFILYQIFLRVSRFYLEMIYENSRRITCILHLKEHSSGDKAFFNLFVILDSSMRVNFILYSISNILTHSFKKCPHTSRHSCSCITNLQNIFNIKSCIILSNIPQI